MRRFTLALALSAIPAAAFGQDVSCSGCDHVAPWLRGEGGFIGTLAEDAGEVVFVASCGSVSTTGEAQVDGRTAVLLFNHRNGLACDREGGSLEIAGLKDGGWYWITDNLNSAVGNLVAKDILGNEPTVIASAGPGVTMTKGSGAVYLKESATGRVGILPNILPEPPTAPTRKCGFSGAGTAASPGKPVQTACALGDGKANVLMTSTNGTTGATVRIHDKGSITRPAGTGSVVLVADLWGNGSGHYVASHSTENDGITAFRGQPSVAMTAARAGARYTGVTYAVNVSTGGPGTGADQVVPSIVRNADSGKVGSASFMIVCP